MKKSNKLPKKLYTLGAKTDPKDSVLLRRRLPKKNILAMYKLLGKNDWDIGFTAGIWYAVELMTIYYNMEDTALWIIKESGIPKKEFVQRLRETQYEEKLLTEKILNQLNDDGSLK